MLYLPDSLSVKFNRKTIKRIIFAIVIGIVCIFEPRFVTMVINDYNLQDAMLLLCYVYNYQVDGGTYKMVR